MDQVLIARRKFVQQVGFGLIAVVINGVSTTLTPAAARGAGVAPRVLTPAEVATLEALGEVLLPGAREAGIAVFVDHQLAAEPAQSLLMLRYMDWPPPYAGFYKAGLAGLDAASGVQFKKRFSKLNAEEAEKIVGSMGQGTPQGWQGIPAQLFYFVVRSDAVDVVYGTEEGFARLGVPYMAHITPSSPW